MVRLRIILTLAILAMCHTAQADSWIFRSSLYSRQAPVKPLARATHGRVVRSGQRNVYSAIVLPGWSFDQFIYRESWSQ